MDLFCHPASGFLAGLIGSRKLNVFESGNVIAAALEKPGMVPGIIAAIGIRAEHLSPAGGDSEPVAEPCGRSRNSAESARFPKRAKAWEFVPGGNLFRKAVDAKFAFSISGGINDT